ncbi:multicopper oxidase family protein [Micromonospora sediminicola]|uniref:multicopper oxidase family protein n=1 Tax=Micromonospora sediminicola TaxID=946078 RepID=UPI0033EBB53A
MLERRHLLAIGTLAAAGGTLGVKAWPASAEKPAKAAANHHHNHGSRTTDIVDPGVPPFSIRMPVPRVLRPVQQRADADVYELELKPANVEILPGVRTAALTYGGDFVGPTIKAKVGRKVLVKYRNRLDHPANAHLHGGHVPADSDGYPLDVISPGASRLYTYPNNQPGTTLWYHDHTHHMEAEHVYRGLHGFYLIEDPREYKLNLPCGEFDVPLMIRDAAFDEAGQLVFDAYSDPYSTRLTTLANGRPQPYFPVGNRRYRFRILNASNHRSFTFRLGGVEMLQIGSDGGLLPAPVSRTELLLSPAERADVVIDFGKHPIGTKLVLDSELGPIVRFDVTRRVREDSQVPAVLATLPALPPATKERQVTLGLSPDQQWFWIDGKPFDENRVDITVKRGTTEIWKITNVDDVFGGIEHNFHLHLVRFRVLDRDGAPPLPGESGWKDTVVIPAGTSVRVQATFGDYTGKYVYHCHLMEHSSVFQMMAQMEIVP